jgi:hypothetical protein
MGICQALKKSTADNHPRFVPSQFNKPGVGRSTSRLFCEKWESEGAAILVSALFDFTLRQFTAELLRL